MFLGYLVKSMPCEKCGCAHRILCHCLFNCVGSRALLSGYSGKKYIDNYSNTTSGIPAYVDLFVSCLSDRLVDIVSDLPLLVIIEIQSSSPSHQTALITINVCSTKRQQFLPTIIFAPMFQYIVPFVLHHSQGTYKPFGNIMLCII